MSLQEYNIGFNVETTAARWGNPQTSNFGNAIRGGFSPYGGVNFEWFPYDPYYTPGDFFGYQQVAVPPPEYLYGNYFGYRGILPLELQNVSPEPYPYNLPYPYNVSA
jgi:hypothetical protein